MKYTITFLLLLLTTISFGYSDLDLIKMNEQYETILAKKSQAAGDINDYLDEKYPVEQYPKLSDIFPFFKGKMKAIQGIADIVNLPFFTGMTDLEKINMNQFYDKYQGDKKVLKKIDKYLDIVNNNIQVLQKTRSAIEKIDKNYYKLDLKVMQYYKEALLFLKDVIEN